MWHAPRPCSCMTSGSAMNKLNYLDIRALGNCIKKAWSGVERHQVKKDHRQSKIIIKKWVLWWSCCSLMLYGRACPPRTSLLQQTVHASTAMQAVCMHATCMHQNVIYRPDSICHERDDNSTATLYIKWCIEPPELTGVIMRFTVNIFHLQINLNHPYTLVCAIHILLITIII